MSAEKPCQDLTNSMQYCLLSIHVHEKLSKELFFSEELPTPPPKTEGVCENPGVTDGRELGYLRVFRSKMF